jgi:hypothetical protein
MRKLGKPSVGLIFLSNSHAGSPAPNPFQLDICGNQRKLGIPSVGIRYLTPALSYEISGENLRKPGRPSVGIRIIIPTPGSPPPIPFNEISEESLRKLGQPSVGIRNLIPTLSYEISQET